VFYYEQCFSTALNGIDRANIMPVTIQIAQVILLISHFPSARVGVIYR
jgi:hypothetical protein